MSQAFELTNVNFDDPNIILSCSTKIILVNKISDFSTISHIKGGPFLFGCSFKDYIAAVGQGETPPNTPFFLQIYQKSSGVYMRGVEFPTKILNVRSNESLLFVCLENSIEVYDTTQFKFIGTIYRKNETGLICCSDKFLIYPDDKNIGQIVVALLPSFSISHSIKAHESSVACMELSNDKTKLITASGKGTLIRVFNIEDGTKIAEYRRGFTKANIRALSLSNEYALACSQNTLHVFNKDGKHTSVSLASTPANCLLDGTKIIVPLSSGVLCLFNINTENFTIQLLNQNRLLTPVQVSQVRFRRPTL